MSKGQTPCTNQLIAELLKMNRLWPRYPKIRVGADKAPAWSRSKNLRFENLSLYL